MSQETTAISTTQPKTLRGLLADFVLKGDGYLFVLYNK